MDRGAAGWCVGPPGLLPAPVVPRRLAVPSRFVRSYLGHSVTAFPSRDVPGTAARLRELKKHRKYGATVDRVGGCFRAGVMERFGAVGDDLQAMVRGACGDLDRDRGEEDWAFSAPSQVTYYMQHLVMAGVMADAAMVDGAIERDVYCRRDPEELRGG